jgi:hypothetical protein
LYYGWYLSHSLEFKIISKHRMISHYLPKLQICLNSLNDDSIWLKESTDLNSIGGIVLHIREHLIRNTARLKDPNVQFAKGIEDQFPNTFQLKSTLIEDLTQAFLSFENAIDAINSEQFNLYNIYHLVEHTGYHLGQIIDRAQRMTGVRFQFVQNGINESALKAIIEEEFRKWDQ